MKRYCGVGSLSSLNRAYLPQLSERAVFMIIGWFDWSLRTPPYSFLVLGMSFFGAFLKEPQRCALASWLLVIDSFFAAWILARSGRWSIPDHAFFHANFLLFFFRLRCSGFRMWLWRWCWSLPQIDFFPVFVRTAKMKLNTSQRVFCTPPQYSAICWAFSRTASHITDDSAR